MYQALRWVLGLQRQIRQSLSCETALWRGQVHVRDEVEVKTSQSRILGLCGV